MNNSSLWIVLNRMRTPLLVLIVSYCIAIIGFLFIEGIDDHGKMYQMNIFDAFYAVTYTATTIGFGELPYPFTYAQKIWMSMIVYATVLGWFYSIGTLVTLLKDQLLLAQIAEAKFVKQVKNINQQFLLVLGYNHITSEIIKKANIEGVRTIVIEKDENKINELLLENYTPIVPCLMADVYDPRALEKAGLNSKHCKAVVSLFTNDNLNLRVALTAKLLNNNVRLAIKSTTHSHSEDLRDLGVEIVENPFEIITEQIEMAIRNPYFLVIEKWLYQRENIDSKIFQLPKGKYIVCGFGRMGKKLYDMFTKNGMEVIFIEQDRKAIRGSSKDMKGCILTGSADEKELLIEAGIKDAVGVIAGTNDDTLNLSILASARKINSNIITIARENEMTGLSVFEHAKIDLVFIPSKVLIDKTTNALISAYSNKFLMLLKEQNDINFVKKLISRMLSKIGNNPFTFGISINDEKAYAIKKALNEGSVIKLEIFSKSRVDREKINKIIPLILIRGKTEILLPSWDTELMVGDKILFASDSESMSDAKYIAQNIYEFHYVYYGNEKDKLKVFLKGLFK